MTFGAETGLTSAPRPSEGNWESSLGKLELTLRDGAAIVS